MQDQSPFYIMSSILKEFTHPIKSLCLILLLKGVFANFKLLVEWNSCQRAPSSQTFLSCLCAQLQPPGKRTHPQCRRAQCCTALVTFLWLQRGWFGVVWCCGRPVFASQPEFKTIFWCFPHPLSLDAQDLRA